MRVACCELRVAGCELRVAGCELRVASCELRVAGCVLRVKYANNWLLDLRGLMLESEIRAVFRDCEALMSGHFLLSSGLHSDAYLEKFRIFEKPVIHSRLIAELLTCYRGQAIDTVLGPALGGMIMAAEAARQLGVRAVYAEKEVGKLTLRRGFKLKKGERTLIVDDIVTTGGSVMEAINIVRDSGAEIVGIGILADRSGGRVDFGMEHRALLNLNLRVFKPEECPLCAEGVVLTKPGSR